MFTLLNLIYMYLCTVKTVIDVTLVLTDNPDTLEQLPEYQYLVELGHVLEVDPSDIPTISKYARVIEKGRVVSTPKINIPHKYRPTGL